jgi:8-oxo-dGTP pyrophosphatase MutT (NUDIX family)
MMLLQQRSTQVQKYTGAFHSLPAGHLHPPATPMVGLLAELSEELGIVEDDVLGTPLLVAVAVNDINPEPERCAVTQVSVSSELMLSRTPLDRWEYQQLLSFPLSRPALEGILSPHVDWVPTGRAAVTRVLELLESGVL